MTKALIIVDMQTDFISGALGSREAVAIVNGVKERAEKLVSEGYTVFFTRDTHNENYMETLEGTYLPVPHCIENSEGWKIIPELQDIPGVYINKYTFGYNEWKQSFDLAFEGREVEEIELMGVCTDICVVSNALILRMLYPNTEITVHADCCAGVTPEKHRAALEIMKSCQIHVVESSR